jgi:hypothetical protein
MSFVLSSLFNNAYSVVCTRQLGARCAYFPIIGAGDMSCKRRCLGPVCHADHGRVKAHFALPISDFDLYKVPGQSVVQRCHRMILCVSLIASSCVLYVTATQGRPAPGDGLECLISARYRPVIGVDRYLHVTAVASVTDYQGERAAAGRARCGGSAGTSGAQRPVLPARLPVL